MKVYFGNLPADMDDARLNELVAPYGKPDSATVVLDRQTRQPRGFGFVEFSNDEQGRAAITGLNGKEVGGKKLVVNEARPQKQRY